MALNLFRQCFSPADFVDSSIFLFHNFQQFYTLWSSVAGCAFQCQDVVRFGHGRVMGSLGDWRFWYCYHSHGSCVSFPLRQLRDTWGYDSDLRLHETLTGCPSFLAPRIFRLFGSWESSTRGWEGAIRHRWDTWVPTGSVRWVEENPMTVYELFECRVRINNHPPKVRRTLEGISWISPLNKRPRWTSLEIPLNSSEFHWIPLVVIRFSLDFHCICLGKSNGSHCNSIEFHWKNIR